MYGEGFAEVYNRLWTGFAAQLAPAILTWYEPLAGATGRRRLLDVCCGTGQLLLYFLEHGYTGAGVDSSPGMLKHARENCARYEREGKVTFLEADASSFHLPGRFDLAVSTFDALNHLESIPRLESCFRCVRAALETGGLFLFDLNTEKGLHRWNGVTVEDSDQLMLVNRGLYSTGMERAYTRITGFNRTGPETWTRFEVTAYNTVFRMSDVAQALSRAGFSESWFAAGRDFDKHTENPEEEQRAFIIARA